ncbi:helix-turn-helix domain-containing protein [Nocardia farcinica]|uniref:helix-turn-helix domain-containing protein n=1 Tax=Nocardia farcinica TaxID=37329 RepID=UPI003CC7FAEE
MDLAGNYSKQTSLLERLVKLSERVARGGRSASSAPEPPRLVGRKKHLTAEETATIVAKYEAGVSMAQLKAEHHMAKRTVAKVLREAGVTVRPKGGQRRTAVIASANSPRSGVQA